MENWSSAHSTGHPPALAWSVVGLFSAGLLTIQVRTVDIDLMYSTWRFWWPNSKLLRFNSIQLDSGLAVKPVEGSQRIFGINLDSSASLDFVISFWSVDAWFGGDESQDPCSFVFLFWNIRRELQHLEGSQRISRKRFFLFVYLFVLRAQ